MINRKKIRKGEVWSQTKCGRIQRKNIMQFDKNGRITVHCTNDIQSVLSLSLQNKSHVNRLGSHLKALSSLFFNFDIRGSCKWCVHTLKSVNNVIISFDDSKTDWILVAWCHSRRQNNNENASLINSSNEICLNDKQKLQIP